MTLSFFLILLSHFEAFSSIACDLAPRLGTLKASSVLHNVLLWAIARAPLVFFDQTPIGRILSRFASDMDATDNKIPEIVSDGIYCFFEVTKFDDLISKLGVQKWFNGRADCTQLSFRNN